MRLIPIPFLALALGCAGVMDAMDNTPASLEVDAPEGVILDTDAYPLAVRVATKSGKLLPDGVAKLAWSATPTAVADVAGGTLRCRDSGDASVVVTGGGVSTTFAVKCRLVATLDVPGPLELLVGEPDAAFEVKALDAKGAVLSDVVPNIVSSAPDIATAEAGRAHAVKLGTATIEVTAGQATASVPVTVIERLTTDTLGLEDGNTVAYTLERGKYRVEVNVRASDGSVHGVEVQFAGGSCPGAAESTTHRLECTVQDTTSLVITNPTTFGMGPPEMGNVTVYRVP